MSVILAKPTGGASGGGSTAWGGITGTLSNQTDLQTALDGKAGASHTHTLSEVTDAGTAAGLDVGTGANNIVQLDGTSKLPAVDGSQLTNLPSGATQLSDLSDVNTSTPTNRNVLVADGVDWESRPLVEADISDLGSYLTTESDTLQTVTDRGATSTNTVTLSPSGNNDALVANGSGTGAGVSITHSGSGQSLEITHSGTGDEIVVNTNEFVVSGGNVSLSGTVDGRDIASDGAKLDGIESGATADQTGAEIKSLYEAEANTNAFTDAEKTKVGYISVTQAVDLDQMETDIAALANGMIYKGDWDASAGTFPGSGSAQTGWFYYVSVGGTVGGIAFNAGDNIVATTDNASTTVYAGNWSKHDQTDAVQSVAGKTGAVTLNAADITDFDTEVSNNASVVANTAKLTCNTANVTAAGALMDSEVDADIKTLSLPANTTISTFGASLVDDADAAAARTTLGVDPAGTDNSTDVTLAGAPNYITIAGQVITRALINLTSHVTGVLPIVNGGTGQTTASAAFDALKQAATTTSTGVVEKSTSAENITGTSDTVYPSVAGVKEMIDTHAGGGGASEGFVHARRSSTVSMSAATKTLIVFNQEEFDTDGLYNTSTGRYTVSSAGKYHIFGAIQFSTLSSNQSVWIYVDVNGTNEVFQTYKSWNVNNLQAFQYDVLLDLAANDYVEIYGYVASGTVAVNGQSGISRTHFNAYKLP